MALAILGLLTSAVLYLVAIYGIVWSSSLRVNRAEDRGAVVDAQLSFPGVEEIVRRHTLEWLIGFALFFTVLALANFPLWQRLGMAGALAVAFGSMWLSQSEPGSAARELPPLRRMGSSVWYWLLAVGDWLGFLGMICFGTDLLVRILE